ncbi:MAG: radical SAM protein [Candidatus Omnitrophica bacterium]|nr:radical SAM protein [Candidatus Omnitrophota bacterium]
MIKQKIGQAVFPKNNLVLLERLDLELTERCNNNCIHCCINLPVDSLEAKNKELSTEDIENILKEAVSLGCITVRFTGGEPLLREDFRELYIFARKLGLRVLIFTNATLIDSSLAELFAHIPPLEKIEVSVYGMKEKSYEAITRAKGSFKAAWAGINLLLKNKIPFVVKGAFLPQNKDELDEFEKWSITIPGMDRKPPAYAMFLDLHCRRDNRKNELIKKFRFTPQEGLNVLSRQKDKYIKGMKEFCSKFMRPSGNKLFTCGSGLGCGCVDAYGYFQPCLMLRHPDAVYNIKQGSLKDALNNFFPKLRELEAVNPGYLSRCAKCFLKGLCEQCPAKSWTEHGTLDTPVDYLCQIAHLQARHLGLIKENEFAWEVINWQERIKDFVNN